VNNEAAIIWDIEAGKALQSADGFLDLNERLKQEAGANGVDLEVSVVSRAYGSLLQGSDLDWHRILVDGRPEPLIDSIWSAELDSELDADDGVINNVSDVPRTADMGELVRKIVIGPNVLPDRTSSDVLEERQRIPLQHIAFVSDDMSDERAGNVVRRGGGLAIAVYHARDRGFRDAHAYRTLDHVDDFARADFRAQSPLEDLLMERVYEIADNVARGERESAAGSAVKELAAERVVDPDREAGVFGLYVDAAEAPTLKVEPLRDLTQTLRSVSLAD